MKIALAFPLFFLISLPAAASNQVVCSDAAKSVELTFVFTTKAKTAPPIKLTLKSGGKTRQVDPNSILRYIRNTTDFYVHFKVQAKSELQEVELNTRINKRVGGKSRISSGFLTNKSQPDSRLTVTCNDLDNSF